MVLELIVTILEIFTDPIKEYIVTPLKNHISYAFTLDRKVERLHHEVEQLQNKRDRLQQSVDAATRNGEQIFPNVTEWLSTSEQDIKQAEILIQGKEEAKNKCCSRFCPNVKTRYQLSKKAHKKALVMEKQLQNAQGFEPIAFRPPPQPIVEHSMYIREALPSRVLMLNGIVDALKDPNLNMIGVYGMGGVGKTTLAKEVRGQALKENLFDTVVMVSVSQTPELRRIQGEIADSLGLKFDAEEVPGRASQLHHRLNKGKVLIILDDIWQKLDLNAIGIPFGDACYGCKILLTSRRKHVLSNEMCTQKEFPLDVLEEEETWRLFEMSVNKANDLELRGIATEVAKKCSGLPLLILKVATDLRNKDSYSWKDMLKRLSSVENTEIYGKVHKVIKLSYEKLIDEEAKSLFLLCALFGNSNILLHDLLIYSLGLGLFQHLDSVEEARNRVLSLIDKLKDECLLLDGETVGFVKIHDVVRDIALAIASRVQHAFVGTSKVRSRDLKNKDFTRVSLPYCDLTELPGVLECPKAEVFSLFAEGLSLDIPNSFFERVKKLKVLHFTGVNFVSGLPSSLGFLKGLQTLCLQRCQLDNVAIVAEMKQLEVLCFAKSDIVELPREIKALTRLKLLDLRGCNRLQVIPVNVLSNMSLLEELYMLNSFDGWDTEGNASLVELKNLSHLTTLEIQFKDDKLLPEDWFFNGIQNYKISIGDWPSHSFEEYYSSRMLQLEVKTSIGLMHRIKELLRGTEVLFLGEVRGIEHLLYDSDRFGIDSFGKLLILTIRKCDILKYLFQFSSAECLPHLQELEVRDCENMEAIVGGGGDVIEFTQLVFLELSSLPNLVGFYKTSGVVSFPNLSSLKVYNCKSLKYVFTTSMVKSLKQLRRLEIELCKSLEEIVLGSKYEEIEEKNIDAIVFPELDYLQLHTLENMKSFSSGYQIEFPKVSELNIFDCQALKKFVPKFPDESSDDDETLFNELVTFSNLEIIYLAFINNFKYLWHQQFADGHSFSKLKSLHLFSCSKLSVVFSSNAYTRFHRLESLSLSSCHGVEEIYEHQGAGFVETNILQFALKEIHLSFLDSLKHIWSKDIDRALSFPDLQSVDVSSCSDLEYIFPASIACRLLQLQHIEIGGCGLEMIIAEAKNEGSEGATTRTFEWPKLKCLKVYNCNKLIKLGFIHNISTQDSPYFVEKFIPNVQDLELDHHSLKAIQNEGFSVELLWKFKQVTLFHLKKKSALFLFGFLRRICSLEKLIFNSGSLGDIFSLDYERAIGEEQHYDLRIQHLELKYIHKLKHIVKKDSQLSPVLERLQTLNISWCFGLIDIAPPSSSASFKYLTTLEVEICPEMTSLVTVSMAKSMAQLMEIRVSNCDMMQEIVVDEGDFTEEADVIIFNKLKLLELNKLPNLNSFCSSNYMFNFPLLEQVSIKGCKQMKIFCGGVLSTPKLEGQGNLNAIIARQLHENW